MNKPYIPRPAGRHMKDPKTGALTRSGPFTDPNAAVKPGEQAKAPSAPPAAPPADADKADQADQAEKKGN